MQFVASLKLVSDPPVEARLRQTVIEPGKALLEETCLQEVTAEKSAHFVGNGVQTQVFCTQESTSYTINNTNLKEKVFQAFGCSSSKQNFSSDKKLNIDGVQSTARNCTSSDEVSLSHSSFTTHSVTMPEIESSTMEAVQEVSLGALLDPGDGAVVALVAGDTRLVAHRAVLSARSPAIAAMFRHGTPEASSGQLTVPDVEGPVLQELLGYLYTLQAPQLPGMAHQLLAAADRYGVSVLKAECEQQVAAQLSVETSAATAVLAIRHSADSLKQAAVAYIKAHLVSVMATQAWADAMHSRLKI
ncbi:protein roadkill-like [Schistocerca serialis cubense]|uniref:protein roadkill-like n=1 Tax=Schistocerca serialis cubense TaxID=2023355 RepID=UPI00214EBAAF|nr:protein roadkill-like [Schistocerca serialis cubense]